MRPICLLLMILACAACGREEASVDVPFAWQRLDSPAGPGSGESHLAVAPDGTVVMSWLEPDGEAHALRYATLSDSAWSAPRTVARGDRWFVNWADFPSVVPITDRVWAAHWLARRPEGGYAYDVSVALSDDGGESWRAPIAPHTDGTPTEHGFVTTFPWHGGVGVVWLDGRNMVPGPGAATDDHGHGDGGMTLRSAVIHDDGTLSHEAVIDDLTCDCCQTDVALGPDGPLVVYRDRSEGEIRDISLSRAEEENWSEPIPVAEDGWMIEGCPVNGPAIDAQGRTVAVAWLTAADDRPRVRIAWSLDGGTSFGAPIDVDAESPLGRVDVVLLGDGDALVSWLASADAGAAVSVRRIGRDGTVGPVRIVGHTAAARPAGFPQMVAADGQIVVSWTEVGEDVSRVVTARAPVDGL